MYEPYIIIESANINKDFYLHYLSFENRQNILGIDNLLGTGIGILGIDAYSNIENGNGIFTGYTSQFDTIYF